MPIPYTRYSFNPPKINQETYESIKKQHSLVFLTSIENQFQEDKNNFIKKTCILHYFFRISMYLFYCLMLLPFVIAAIASNIFGYSYYKILNEIVENGVILVFYIIVMIGFIGGISYNLSYGSFKQYLRQRRKWFKKLKIYINSTSDFHEFENAKYS
jgi:hypothetical protein